MCVCVRDAPKKRNCMISSFCHEVGFPDFWASFELCPGADVGGRSSHAKNYHSGQAGYEGISDLPRIQKSYREKVLVVIPPVMMKYASVMTKCASVMTKCAS